MSQQDGNIFLIGKTVDGNIVSDYGNVDTGYHFILIKFCTQVYIDQILLQMIETLPQSP